MNNPMNECKYCGALMGFHKVSCSRPTIDQPNTAGSIIARLNAARDVAWSSLIPAFDLAIIQAEQADYEASCAANLAQCSVSPAYPPLVLRLAESGRKILEQS